MRAEERHEMRENDLANWLRYGLWGFLRQNGSYILLALALCFLGYRLWGYYQQKKEYARQSAFIDLQSALQGLDELAPPNDLQQGPRRYISSLPRPTVDVSVSAADLMRLAKQDMDAGRLREAAARYLAVFSKPGASDTEKRDADGQLMVVLQKELDRALQGLATLIDTSEVKEVRSRAALRLGQAYAELPLSPVSMTLSRSELLGKAYDFYSKVLEIQGEDALLADKAHLGMAAVYEDRGDWDKAKAEYQIIVDGPNFAGPSAEQAKAKLETLDARHNSPRLASWVPPLPMPAVPTSSPAGLQGFPGGLFDPRTPGTSILPPIPGGSGGGNGGGIGGGLGPLFLGPPSPTTGPAGGLNLTVPPLGGGGLGGGGLGGGMPTTPPAVPEAPKEAPK